MTTQQDIPDLIAGALGVSRGTAYDLMREALAGAQQESTCNKTLREQGKAYPRTCKKCGLWPCIADRVQPAQQQEPVADINVRPPLKGGDGPLIASVFWHKLPVGSWLLYTSPPPRKPWVGLTEEEENDLWEGTDSDWELMKRTEAKLKEKNA